MENNYSTTPQTKDTIQALWRLQKIILNTLDFNQVVQQIVDSLLLELGYLNLGYRIIVLTLVDPKTNVLKRISLSSTEEAQRALDASAVPFHDIEIPLNTDRNLLVKTLNEQKPNITSYWPDIFTPILDANEALQNQKAAGIKTSMLFPIIVKEKSIGVLIFSMIKEENEVPQEERDLIRGYTDIVGLAVQNAQLYSSVMEAKAKIEATNQKLKVLDRLKDEFVSLASHELRTPMTAIKSYLWLFLEDNKQILNDQQKMYVERAYSSTDRLINLVNDMLNVSRIESGRLIINKKQMDLAKLLNESVAEFQPTATEQKKTLTFSPPLTPLPMVNADPEKIKQVLSNLIGNSVKFTPDGGSINLYVKQDGGMITVSVKDTGKGISNQDMGKLFKKFGIVGSSSVLTHGAQSTGLGLYLSKGIVELHGGTIWVESEGEGKGSVFSFSLPIAQASSEASETQTDSPAANQGTPSLPSKDQQASSAT